MWKLPYLLLLASLAGTMVNEPPVRAETRIILVKEETPTLSHPLRGDPKEGISGLREYSCPMCAKPIVPSQAAYVILSAQGKTNRLTLRCVHCALQTVRTWKPATAMVRVRCPVTRRWVTFHLREGSWTAEPATTRLILAPEAKGECLDRHLAFVSRRAARRYVRSHPALRQYPVLTIGEVK